MNKVVYKLNYFNLPDDLYIRIIELQMQMQGFDLDLIFI